MFFLKNIISLFLKDIIIELRTREIFYTMAFFSLLSVIIFSFAFYADPQKSIDYGPGIIWVTILFSGTIGIGRIFDRERENNVFYGILLTPVSPSAVFLSKVLTQIFFLFLMEIFALPLIVIFFDIKVINIFLFIGGILLGNIGFSFVGVLFGAMLMNERMKEVLLPLVIYPVLVPLFIAGVNLTKESILPFTSQEAYSWLKLIGGGDIIFIVMSIFLFERMVFK